MVTIKNIIALVLLIMPLTALSNTLDGLGFIMFGVPIMFLSSLITLRIVWSRSSTNNRVRLLLLIAFTLTLFFYFYFMSYIDSSHNNFFFDLLDKFVVNDEFFFGVIVPLAIPVVTYWGFGRLRKPASK